MSEVKEGNAVKVHYTGRLEDGSEFDSSQGRDPLEFTVGEGMVIPGFETAVVGMEVGDQKTVEIESDNAYGPHREELMQNIERNRLPDHIELEKGLQLQAQREGAQPMVVTVVDFDEEQVTLDANHPLAGKKLIFDIELVEVE